MSRLAKARFFFGDRDYEFALQIEQLIDLEELFPNTGAELMGRQLQAGLGTVRQTKEVLRLALIGSEAKTPIEAFDFVEKHVVVGDLQRLARMAGTILGIAFVGAPEEVLLGEQTAGEETAGEETIPTPPSPTAESDGAASTA